MIEVWFPHGCPCREEKCNNAVTEREYNRVAALRRYGSTESPMRGKKTFADNSAMREIAMSILKSCGDNRDLVLQVERLMNSAADTLSKTAALKRLDQLRMRCLGSSKM